MSEYDERFDDSQDTWEETTSSGEHGAHQNSASNDPISGDEIGVYWDEDGIAIVESVVDYDDGDPLRVAVALSPAGAADMYNQLGIFINHYGDPNDRIQARIMRASAQNVLKNPGLDGAALGSMMDWRGPWGIRWMWVAVFVGLAIGLVGVLT